MGDCKAFIDVDTNRGAVGCLFHDEQLLILRYKDKAVPYSIDFTPTEAYSAMQAREKQPAKRYIDICYLLKN